MQFTPTLKLRSNVQKLGEKKEYVNHTTSEVSKKFDSVPSRMARHALHNRRKFWQKILCTVLEPYCIQDMNI
jgi:hypothetical protein